MIVDDQAIVRTGMAMILSVEDDITVVAEAEDGVQAVDLAARHCPDVVLMDIRMPRLDGLDALRALTRPGARHTPRVVMVTTFDDDEYVTRAIRSGACGFVLKDSGPRLLAEAVRAAAAGDSLISPSITVRLLEKVMAASRLRDVETDLSPREVEVVRLVARADQRRDRRRAVHHRGHRQDPPDQRPGQAGGAQSGGDRRVGLAARLRRR
ncbi:Protein-glutamate methylesterase/protein-glutamine glutaminase [Streptomyces glaucescens]